MIDYLYTQRKIIALRNEKGSYNHIVLILALVVIIALRNEKGSYNIEQRFVCADSIIALRNEKGSYYNTV